MKRMIFALIALMLGSGAALAQSGYSNSMKQARRPAVLKVKQSDQYDAYLVDKTGRALYTIVNEDSPDNNVAQGAKGAHIKAEVVPCTSHKCLQMWPALLTKGKPVAKGKADSSQITTYTRSDGSTQVVYGGYTLFYFARDKQPGDTNGQGMKGFGGTWYLVSPKGEEIEESSSKTSEQH